jgi:hypothetical protein
MRPTGGFGGFGAFADAIQTGSQIMSPIIVSPKDS